MVAVGIWSFLILRVFDKRGLNIEMLLTGKGYAYGFLSTVVEVHHRLIGLWVAIYC